MTTTPDPNCPLCFGRGRYDDDGDRWIECVCMPEKNLTNKNMTEFQEFPKIARLSRECIITEKIDGTNAQIFISETGDMLFGSRSRWITPQDDNYGFAKWAESNRDDILKLGPGRHFGEWWGNGYQRGYGLSNGEKRFSLFNAIRWCPVGERPKEITSSDPRIQKLQDVAPSCCHVVPTLFRGIFSTEVAELCLGDLRSNGSKAAPGFMNAEGIIIFHISGNVGFKKTLQKDSPKGFAQ